jgi:signal transduction histidine kinase
VGRPADLFPRRARWTALAAYVVVVAIGTARLNPNPPLAVAAGALALAAGAWLAGARREPLLLRAAVATGAITILGYGLASNVSWFAVCLVGGWCALAGGPRVGLAYGGGAFALFGAQWLWVTHDPGWGAWMGGTALTVLTTFALRRERDLVTQLRAAQASLANQARVAERNRIARELHDVIGHTLTVALLHITSARLAVEHDPPDAARALAEAERLGRESLAEVRSAVGLLRQDDPGHDPIAPPPSADGLPRLVERFRSARADVTLTVNGDTAGLPATVGLVVYRIVQEALTNAVKHAPGAPVAVALTIATDQVVLRVDSAGEPRHGEGMGLLSMRERAESLGGGCEAGPGGRGWLVQAHIPLAVASRQEATA